jgi:hypothetical protein
MAMAASRAGQTWFNSMANSMRLRGSSHAGKGYRHAVPQTQLIARLEVVLALRVEAHQVEVVVELYLTDPKNRI